jgi:hypothetical protein
MSRAIELYRVVHGTTVYTMTPVDTPQTYASGAGGTDEIYYPVTLGRGGIQSKQQLSRENIELRLPLTHALSQDVLTKWIEVKTSLTIFSMRASGTEVIWKGRLASSRPDNAHARLIFESIFTSMRRPGLRARFQRSCRHPLYGRGCYVNPEDFAVAATISSINGRTLVVPAAAGQSNGYFSGGMLKAPDGTFSYIAEHAGSALTMNRVSSSISSVFTPGLAVTIYPGCPHDFVTCRDRFANDDNYGGFDYIPDRNPMGGLPII